MKSKNHFQGDLTKYQKQLNRLSKGGCDFRVEYNGSKRTIVYLDESGEESLRTDYFGKSVADKFTGAHIVYEVKKAILRRISAGEKRPEFIENSSVVSFNKAALQKCIDNGGKCVGLDINSCYWVTAHILGVIDGQLFEKYIAQRAKWKKGMVASIGALNKKKATAVYKDGKIKTHYMDIEYGILRAYYWAVINRVSRVMQDVISQLGDSFLMWLTDCVYVTHEDYEKAIEVISLWGYEVKQYNAKILSVTANKIEFKNDKKSLPTYVNYSFLHDVGSVEFEVFPKHRNFRKNAV